MSVEALVGHRHDPAVCSPRPKVSISIASQLENTNTSIKSTTPYPVLGSRPQFEPRAQSLCCICNLSLRGSHPCPPVCSSQHFVQQPPNHAAQFRPRNPPPAPSQPAHPCTASTRIPFLGAAPRRRTGYRPRVSLGPDMQTSGRPALVPSPSQAPCYIRLRPAARAANVVASLPGEA